MLVKAESIDGRPNVLFIAVDDMKDWVNCLGGYEGDVYTPNIDRLAKRGMLFTNAHCASPKCAPSRVAIMTGLKAQQYVIGKRLTQLSNVIFCDS